ncbi:Bug family tripartite tricarboxylate transporter substrate binding protein [Burkholderiaceae bacterium UC74_6]
MNTTRRAALSALAAAAVTPLDVFAQDKWPSKPIRLIVPLAAGSAVDNGARIVLQKVGEHMGQTFVIDNIAGAAGMIGAEKIAHAAPDGYTLGGVNDSVLTMVPHLQSRLTWNTLTDFEPISLVGTVEWGLVVRTDSPYKTLAEFLAAAKASPGKLSYGSGGNGSPQHIGMALLLSRARLDMMHVPYKGATPAAVAAAAGEVDACMQGLGTVVSLLQSGKLRLLAVSTPTRLAQYPNVPTFAEAGLPGFTFNSWFALIGPAKLPKPIVQRLNVEITKALADPAVHERLIALGITPRGMGAAEFGQATKAQYELYRKLIQERGIKAD